MPLPQYIIGSESRSEDRTTGRVSVFNVLEHVTTANAPPEETMDWLRSQNKNFSTLMVFISSWMRTADEDPERVYAAEWRLFAPMSAEPKTLHQYEFKIPGKCYRFTLNAGISPPSEDSGIFTVENRVRYQEGEWLSQRFRFFVDVVPVKSMANVGEPDDG
jgi:hypothetical protein